MELPVTFQLKGNADKSHQHEGKEKTIPELQPPFDGIENHFQGNIQHSTPNNESTEASTSQLDRSMLKVER